MTKGLPFVGSVAEVLVVTVVVKVVKDVLVEMDVNPIVGENTSAYLLKINGDCARNHYNAQSLEVSL